MSLKVKTIIHVRYYFALMESSEFATLTLLDGFYKGKLSWNIERIANTQA